MKTRVILFLVLAVGIISGAQLSSLVLTISPYTARSTELWLFFVSLYLFATAVLSLLWYALRHVRGRRGTSPSLGASIRQAALLTLVVVISLFFRTLGILQYWDIIPLLAAAILIEFFFQAEKKPHATLSYDHATE